MIIRNLTSDTQLLKVIELVGGREFNIYIEGNGCTDIQGMYLRDMSQLGDTFEIVDIIQTKAAEKTICDTYLVDESQEELDESKDEKSEDKSEDEESQEESTTPVSDKFICDVCGAEFASARGLTSHKNRSHLEE